MSKRWVDILALACLLFIAYTSMIPFDFSRSAPSTGHGDYWGIQITEANVPDVFSNLALYVPLGLILRAFFARHRIGPAASLLGTLLIAGCLSFSMELVQTLLVSRISSVADLVCNVLGAAIGIALYHPESALARRSMGAVRAELVDEPTGTLAGGWAMLTALTALVPLDMTFDVSLLAKAVRGAYFVPFAKHAALAQGAGTSTVGPQLTGEFVSVEMWHLGIDYVLDVFMFLVLGVLVARRFAVRGHGGLVSSLAAFGISTALAVLITGMGLFVLSVGFDVTRILTRIFGGLVGAVFHGVFLGVLFPGSIDAVNRSGNPYRRILLAGIAGCVLYICARQLVPFRMVTEGALAKMASFEWMPFQTYSLSKLPQAALDVLHKSFRFAALGVLTSLFFITERRRVIRAYRFKVGWWSACLVAVLELAQCWLPGRVPAITDVLIAWCVTVCGVVIGEFLYNGYHMPQTDAAVARGQRVILNVELGQAGRSARPSSIKRRRRRRRVRR